MSTMQPLMLDQMVVAAFADVQQVINQMVLSKLLIDHEEFHSNSCQKQQDFATIFGLNRCAPQPPVHMIQELNMPEQITSQHSNFSSQSAHSLQTVYRRECSNVQRDAWILYPESYLPETIGGAFVPCGVKRGRDSALSLYGYSSQDPQPALKRAGCLNALLCEKRFSIPSGSEHCAPNPYQRRFQLQPGFDAVLSAQTMLCGAAPPPPQPTRQGRHRPIAGRCGLADWGAEDDSVRVERRRRQNREAQQRLRERIKLRAAAAAATAAAAAPAPDLKFPSSDTSAQGPPTPRIADPA